jgi:hypothetical protein
MAPIELDPLSDDGGPGIPEKLQRSRIAAKFNPNLLQDPVGLIFNARQMLFIEQIIARDLSCEES